MNGFMKLFGVALRSAAIAFALAFIMLLVIGAVVLRFPDPDRVLSVAAYLPLVLCAFVSGLLVMLTGGEASEGRSVVAGLVTGGCYLGLHRLLSLIVAVNSENAGEFAPLRVLVSSLILLAASVAGALLCARRDSKPKKSKRSILRAAERRAIHGA